MTYFLITNNNGTFSVRLAASTLEDAEKEAQSIVSENHDGDDLDTLLNMDLADVTDEDLASIAADHGGELYCRLVPEACIAEIPYDVDPNSIRQDLLQQVDDGYFATGWIEENFPSDMVWNSARVERLNIAIAKWADGNENGDDEQKDVDLDEEIRDITGK